MITTGHKSRIWRARHKVDFRKQHNGLLAEAYKLSLDPYKGDVIIFIGRTKKKIKVLYADSTGLWVSGKVFTLESIKTQFRFLFEPMCDSITEAELSLLIEGARYTIDSRVKTYSKSVDQKRKNEQSSSCA